MYCNRAARVDRLKEVIEIYPLPAVDSLRVEFRCTRSGEIWVHKFVGEKTQNNTDLRTENWAPVVSPMGVSALLQMANEDDAYGLRVVVQDMRGEPRIVDFQRGELARLGASEIRARLFAAGLRMRIPTKSPGHSEMMSPGLTR